MGGCKNGSCGNNCGNGNSWDLPSNAPEALLRRKGFMWQIRVAVLNVHEPLTMDVWIDNSLVDPDNVEPMANAINKAMQAIMAAYCEKSPKHS